MKRALGLIAALVLIAACDRRDRFAAPDSARSTPPPLPECSAYLSASTLSPSAGANVLVAGGVTTGSELSLASFRVRLAYDTALLQFLEEVPLPGMLRVVNATKGEIVVVGASAGASDGKLFAMKFRVIDPAGLSSLLLAIDELNDTSFVDQKGTVTRASRLVEDSSLMPGKVVPSTPSSVVSPASAAEAQPAIDSITPREATLDRDRVTDVVIYGRGFAARGNVVHFGDAVVPGLMSEAGGKVIRFTAPSRRGMSGRLAVRVVRDGTTSNVVSFRVRGEDR